MVFDQIGSSFELAKQIGDIFFFYLFRSEWEFLLSVLHVRFVSGLSCVAEGSGSKISINPRESGNQSWSKQKSPRIHRNLRSKVRKMKIYLTWTRIQGIKISFKSISKHIYEIQVVKISLIQNFGGEKNTETKYQGWWNQCSPYPFVKWPLKNLLLHRL